MSPTETPPADPLVRYREALEAVNRKAEGIRLSDSAPRSRGLAAEQQRVIRAALDADCVPG